VTGSFTCPDCGATSYSRNDVEHGYCGHCHRFTGGRAAQAVLRLTRRPDVEVLAETWDRLAPKLLDLIGARLAAGDDRAELLEVLGLVGALGVAVEGLRRR
jgi:hypothetical protein